MTGPKPRQPRLKRFDIIANSAQFDAAWYEDTFGDVALSGLGAQAHYEDFGFMLGRGVSPDMPLIRDAPSLFEALTRQPRISYCTPIMNRPDDIRNTLEYNLTENRAFDSQIEFVLIFGDADTDTQTWVRDTFSADLASGYLRLITVPPMDGWHFGVAKNLHRPFATGEIYSSLDGDNFVTRQETAQLLDIADAHPGGFIFHHFSGDWGDGSSGRISLPMSLYRTIGYDPRFMPRQFDEMDVIISAMSAGPSMPLIRLASNDKGFGSKRTDRFLEDAGLRNPVVMLDPPLRQAPLNPKGTEYVGNDPVLAAMTSFNQGLCFFKNAPSLELREAALQLAVDARHKIIDALPRDRVLSTLFHTEDRPRPGELTLANDDVCVFACMKNDDIFLVDLYAHYKTLGVTRFFIVDDGSDTPIRDVLGQSDVHVFKPKVGTFVTSKGMWMEGLMKAYLEPGQWALTVDADEFIDLPEGYTSFSDLARALKSQGREYLPGILIDMVPGQSVSSKQLAAAESNFLDLFDHFVSVDTPPDPAYFSRPSVSWGFGDHAALSWQLDTRFHAFGTFDALRKVPLFQVRPGRHIDQGFHSLIYTDGTAPLDAEIWDTDMALPIRHYKLIKLFSDQARTRMAAQVASAKTSQYHARTTANIARIFGGGQREQMQALMSLPSLPYQDSFLRRLNPSSHRIKHGAAPDSGPHPKENQRAD